MARARELPGDEPSDEPAADDGEVLPARRALFDPVQFDVSKGRDAAPHEETKYAISTVLARRHITRTKSAERPARHRMKRAGRKKNTGRDWRNGAGFARSPETSLAGITRIGCKGSLSASPRCRPFRPPMHAKHPCFVEDH
jgi:hypothetical protein